MAAVSCKSIGELRLCLSLLQSAILMNHDINYILIYILLLLLLLVLFFLMYR